VSGEPVGFVGLGKMGGALAANLAKAGHPVIAYDARGPQCAPGGVAFAAGADEVARRAELVVLSLPDGTASEQVASEILAAANRRTTHVIDTSTIGIRAAESLAASLGASGIEFVDAPVSGGVAGARNRTLAVMYSASAAACARVEPVLAGLSDRRYRVGERAGLAQAMKLLNNFLSATALAATSEAIAFGRHAGLEMRTMLEVLNASSGRSSATSDKFPEHVLSGRYASGFSNSLMAKDVELYLAAVRERGCPSALGELTRSIWRRFAAAQPDVDFTRIYPFVEGS
jgi:3-hydroxyisobutyrate dehydrogenase-like beta-hydroxyacid dehydrogenase